MKNYFEERRPWKLGAEVLHQTRAAMKLRNSLTPYIYSAMFKMHTSSIPLVSPMYYFHKTDESFLAGNQHYFGSELLVAVCSGKCLGTKGNSRLFHLWIQV